MRTIFLTALLLPLLAACENLPGGTYFNRGAPESLLDVSAEVVTFELADPLSVQQMSDWIYQDQPTRAELYCMEGDPICDEARIALERFGVPVTFVSAADNNVMLVYERVVARDCENRFIDNTINPYNLNHPTFGCATAANIVQHVTDKGQFVSPQLKGQMDGRRAAQTAAGAQQPNTYAPAAVDPNFEELFSIESQGGGGGGG